MALAQRVAELSGRTVREVLEDDVSDDQGEVAAEYCAIRAVMGPDTRLERLPESRGSLAVMGRIGAAAPETSRRAGGVGFGSM